MNRHRPTSEKSQDISHVLANIFKDIYTREIIGNDTVFNLTKTKRGGMNYHDKYVEELQQVHSEYSRRIREADMLENHIIQARLQATATESEAYANVVEEVGEAYHQLGLPPGKSTFMWCVDNGLLKSNNLISPQDYIIKESPLAKAPIAKFLPGFVVPTIANNRHVSRQDDDQTVIPPQTHNRLMQSETDLTLMSSLEPSTIRSTPTEKTCQLPRPKWMDEPSAKSRADARDTLQKMGERRNFLRNPRFLAPNAPRGGKSLILPRKRVESLAQGMEVDCCLPDTPVPVFLANPPVVIFADYEVGKVYETTVELRNLTSTSRHVRVIPPTTPYFSIGLGRFPGEGGTVAPGMCCHYTVRFAPDSLANYEDFLVVETQAQYPLIVPINARRPPPILTLPSVMDCGYCLVGGVKYVEFLCRNDGQSAGTFCVIPKSKWPASNLRCILTASFSEQPPFGVCPSLFELEPGQATVVEVVFFPTAAGRCTEVFTIVCDNCQVKDVTIQGEAQLIKLELVSVSGEGERPVLGEMRDLTAEHFVSFDPGNLYSEQQKKLIIRNNAHLELPFHWQIMKPNLQPLLPGETPDPSRIQYHLATDEVFHVSPPTGVLAPLQEREFLITYCPKKLRDYHSVCHLVLRDIPDMPKEPSAEGTSRSLEGVLNVPVEVGDVIVMEIEVKGSTEPYQVLLEPYSIHVPGGTFVGTTLRRRFKMWNSSRSSIRFQWEKISDTHIVEVEPSTGELEVNECFDLELFLTGGKPGKVVTSLLCHIQHHHQPVSLSIEATFKGPCLSLNVPSVDLGLLRLGDQALSTVLLTNTTELEASWTLTERTDSQRRYRSQVAVEPCSGVLPPRASCSVDVLFRPELCQHFETMLELAVEDGTGCHLSVQADVQSPQVCLLNCKLVFPELYLGLPARGMVTLFNQTLLPADFTWNQFQLQGNQASMCTASFSPSSGSLGPNNKMEITVAFTANTDMELTEVAALCEVQGMKDPLVLSFSSKARRLSVSYAIPHSCPASEEQEPSSLVLDFGGDVILKRERTKQFEITNHTAIPAPFTMTAEYFIGHTPRQASDKIATHVKRPIHSVQARKLEEKAHEDFVSRLLAHGRGAAFYVQPDSGMLGPFETQTIDITAYSDMWGEYRDLLICKVGDLQPKLIPIVMTVTGCPLYFQMIGPQPDNQNQGPVVRFGTHVSGGDTVSRSLRINNPSPCDIRMDWETYNIEQEDRKLLDLVVAYGEAFPLKDVDGNEMVGGALADEDGHHTWDSTGCTGMDGTSSCPTSTFGSSVSIQTDMEGEDNTGVEEEGSPYPTALTKKLFSVYIRPHKGNAADYPYCITPQQLVVPAGGSSTMHVSFTPLTLSGPTDDSCCVGFARGFMSLDSKMASCIPGKVVRDHGLELEPLRLNLQATVKPALLLVQMEEDEEVLQFYAVASDILQGDTKKEKTVAIMHTFQLKNTTEVPLSFRLSVEPPFSVVQPQAKARARTGTSGPPPIGECQPLVLQPQHNMQVKVAFHNSLSLLAYLRQPAEELPPTVSLVHGDSGERRLRFQQSLLVQYSNNSLQTVPVCAHLDLPTVHLSCESVDFGICLVGQTQVKEVHFYSRGGCGSWKALLESEEKQCQTFRVLPDCGVLMPQEVSVLTCRQPLQISFTASDEKEFSAMVFLQGVLLEPSPSLHVWGRGSFDERYGSPQVEVQHVPHDASSSN
ncbi:deleted in lung and esophageal cancer protein 1 [Aplochiton taeniatus]